ncbi:MAG: cytochrome C biosynthesis protein [Flavobacterium sp.]|nr:cytochrome C biosynthesis protein [Flavobacterium sp.]
MKKIPFLIICLLLLCCNLCCGQNEPEDVVSKVDEFENLFFESIKQKGMENFDKAIESLEKCSNLQPNNAVVFFELGKNYLFQKNYVNAFQNFQKATQIDATNRWFWAGMYDVCYDTKDYNKAVPIVEKLIEFKEDYKNDLVSLYMNTQQFDKALQLINELNAKFGKDDKRDIYKAQILRDAKFQDPEKNNLLEQIRLNPKDESNYIALILLYSESNQEQKVLEIAKKLEKEVPSSEMAQVSLFKFYLNSNEGQKAVQSMNVVLASTKIDKKIKHRVLNEFLLFTKSNPQFDADLNKAISYFDNDPEVKVAKEIGKFYYLKKDYLKAANYFIAHLKTTNDDIEVILLLGQSYILSNQFLELSIFCEQNLQLFPTQPQLYYYSGLANNQLKKFKNAKDALETGLDFIVDDVPLQVNFYIQLGEAFAGMQDLKNKEIYFNKANELLKKIKK